jgi:hypothetical protein
MTLPAQDIVERLRLIADHCLFDPDDVRDVHKAADTISRLTADNEALRKELAETEQERVAAYEDADHASESALRSEQIGMEWQSRALAAESRVTALEAENEILREDQNTLDKLLQLMGIADSDCAPDEVLQGILEAFDQLNAWNAEFLHHDQWEVVAAAFDRWNKGERADDYTLGIVYYGFKHLMEANLSFLAALGGSDHG